MEHREPGMSMVAPCEGREEDRARFLRELRQLRDGAGLGHAELAARAHYPCEAIKAAEAGPALPDLPVLSAYVRGCGGTVADWEERWRTLTSSPALPLLPVRAAGSSDAATAGARIGSASLAADGHDPAVVMAALSRVAGGIATDPVPDWRSPGSAPGPGSPAASSPGSAASAAGSSGSASALAGSSPRPAVESGSWRAAAQSSAGVPTAGVAVSISAGPAGPRHASVPPEPGATARSRPASSKDHSSLKSWITTIVIVLCMVAALVVIFS